MEVKKHNFSSIYGNATYYFCNKSCKETFDKEPENYLKIKSEQEKLSQQENVNSEKTSFVKKYHTPIMMLACILPIIVLLIAVTYFGISRSYLFWAVLLICPITHFLMMRNMHKTGGGCH